jgi:orotate phosphoribosyltransferase
MLSTAGNSIRSSVQRCNDQQGTVVTVSSLDKALAGATLDILHRYFNTDDKYSNLSLFGLFISSISSLATWAKRQEELFCFEPGLEP